MKKYTYWIVATLIMGSLIYLISRPELEPQNLPKIKFTQVENPAIFGELILKQLQTEVRLSPVLLLGVTPEYPEDLELWKAFLAANTEPGLRYDMVIVDPQLPRIETIPTTLKMDLKTEMDRFAKGIMVARAQNMRVAVIVPTIYASQLLSRNPADILKNAKAVEFTSFSIVKFPKSLEQAATFQPGCSVDKEDREGTGPLGCMLRTKARKTYRAKLEPEKFSGLMDQIDANDYLILFNKN